MAAAAVSAPRRSLQGVRCFRFSSPLQPSLSLSSRDLVRFDSSRSQGQGCPHGGDTMFARFTPGWWFRGQRRPDRALAVDPYRAENEMTGHKRFKIHLAAMTILMLVGLSVS